MAYSYIIAGYIAAASAKLASRPYVPIECGILIKLGCV